MNRGFGEESKCLKISSKRFGSELIREAVKASSRAGPGWIAGFESRLEMQAKSEELGFW